jgi:hypothetical protein
VFFGQGLARLKQRLCKIIPSSVDWLKRFSSELSKSIHEKPFLTLFWHTDGFRAYFHAACQYLMHMLPQWVDCISFEVGVLSFNARICHV